MKSSRTLQIPRERRGICRCLDGPNTTDIRVYFFGKCFSTPIIFEFDALMGVTKPFSEYTEEEEWGKGGGVENEHFTIKAYNFYHFFCEVKIGFLAKSIIFSRLCTFYHLLSLGGMEELCEGSSNPRLNYFSVNFAMLFS